MRHPAPTSRCESATPNSQVAASDPGSSVWVAANAGTGKTWVLVDRITRLLVDGVRPDRILCLTFTKAAAAEMANRLGERLGAWSVMEEWALTAELAALLGRRPSPPVVAAARRLLAETLEGPGSLNIRTIHSFCESLLARFPLEAGVAPHFSVIDERTAAELMVEARDRMFAGVADGDGGVIEALDRLAGEIDEEAFGELMQALDANRSRLRLLIADLGGLAGVRKAVQAALGLAPGETPDGVIEAACRPGAADETGLVRAAGALDRGSPADRARARGLRAWITSPNRVADFEAYQALFLTQTGAPRATSRLITKAAQAADGGAPAILEAEQRRLAATLERRKAASVARATGALLTVGTRLLESYQTLKERRALLDYDDLILTARRLLAEGSVGWVHYKLDGGIDHILVDEAQDTSREQWDIIAALADEFFAGIGTRERPRTVFAVGDEKQSIFSFQGADPEAFDAMRAHFEARAADQGWRTVGLERSFRSVAAILDVVDRVFAQPAAGAGLVSSAGPMRHRTNRAGEPGLVELWPTVVPDPTAMPDPWDAPLDHTSAHSPQARLAARIADVIRGWLDRGERLESAARPIRPGDIMILVRTRSAFFEEMVRCLKARDIPVAGADRMVLTEQLAVMDLVALGRFVLLPEDDLNLAVVLKAPMIGFDDEQLFALAHGRPASLWRALADRRNETPEFARAWDRLSALRARADRAPPFEFFAEILGRDGDRRRLLRRLGSEARDPVDEFLSLALEHERHNVPSLQGFLHWLEVGNVNVKRDLEHGRGEVRVMTVHGAKGLQAEVVFLPDTCTVPDPRVESRILWQADRGGIMVWAPRRADEEALCRRLRLDARRRADEEFRRLLYVAMTRARDRLYVCGWEGPRGRSPGCWYDLVAPVVRDAGREVELPFGATGWRVATAEEAEIKGMVTPAEAEPAQPLPAWAATPAPAEPVPPRPLAPSRPTEDEPPVRSPLEAGDGARFRRGRLVHRLLQTLPELAPAARRAAARTFLGRAAPDVAESAREAIAAETLAVIEDPALAQVFGPGSRAEVPLAGVVRGRVVAGRVDRLVVTDRRVVVADFKTDRLPPAGADQVPAPYRRQMAAYRDVLAMIYPDRPIGCVIVWTEGPKAVEIKDDSARGGAP